MIIVGGGVMGMMQARELAQQGLEVGSITVKTIVFVERDRLVLKCLVFMIVIPLTRVELTAVKSFYCCYSFSS